MLIEMEAKTIESKDLLLSSEERYEIWNVKKEERPYLLSLNEEEQNEEASDDEELSSASAGEEMPLLDGCDFPQWRKERLVSVTSYTKGILNVGSGCFLLRRETQLPMTITPHSLSTWQHLQKKLLMEPRKTAVRLTAEETRKLIEPYPWFEKENVPAILEGCTDAWRAMETCTWENLLRDFGHYDWRFSDTHGACMTLQTYTKYVRSIEGLTGKE